MLLKDKTAVIFGESGAIVGAIAKVLARNGARLWLGGRSQNFGAARIFNNWAKY
ncbi:hypothetical protein RM190_08830 [Paracoccus sp. CPCC 101403]|uniref:Uncharacterized protein n=1 Tax=Paracoccus broussonetiae TaxID=3075834 RepID=A0ABU3EDS7_9RHOB|nr:hypothetical protein [Paracoccus sp. CPCC 101403]MDT1061957.1 hypothetical protein [Paracoccus sp. CPCC 101403]